MKRATLLNLAAIATLGAPLFGRGQKRRLPRTAALCAVAALAALAILIAAAWHSSAYADGGASARSQAGPSAPDDSGATIEDYAQLILRALADDDTNNWVRYWQARADCDAAVAHDIPAAAPLDRVLLTLTAALCAQLDARLAVNPADYSPRGEERTVGLTAIEPEAAMGYTLFTGPWIHDVFLLDPLGRVAHTWHWDTPLYQAKLLDNGNLLTALEDIAFEFDPRGNIVWQYKVDGNLALHHDFLKMPNGNALLLVRGVKTREEAIAAGANPEFARRIKPESLLEVRPIGASGGEVVWEWSPWDHLVQDFDPTKPNYGVIAEHPELIDINFAFDNNSYKKNWPHINTIDYNPELDQIMLSSRDFSELWIIDHSATMEEARGHSGGNGGMGGDLLYRWGNPRAYDHGTPADQRLFWQHQTHWIPPGLPGAGNILAFNNGLEFPDYERFYSSIDEIAPPLDGRRYRRDANSPYPPAKPEWTYVADPPSDFYAPIGSGAQRLPNGNTLVLEGATGTIFQATTDGRIVWKYVAPLHFRSHLRQGERPSAGSPFPTPYGDPVRLLSNRMYRAYWYPPDHPGLQALDLTPGNFVEDSPDLYDRTYAASIAGDFGESLALSDFDIYLDEDKRRLIYIKRPCATGDARHKFFLRATPANPADLPNIRRERGYDNLEWRFAEYGADVDGACVVARNLPVYPVKRVSTGQFTAEGQVWQAEIEMNE